jgi:methionyl-tRNA synthetase
MTTFLSTTIPYVNAQPHLGFALELVQGDVLARHGRQAGDQVRYQTGTDDNSLKNVLAAEAEGISPATLVGRNAAAFAGLREPLALSFDDFIRTSSDPRHRPGVERLWRACVARGDLYLKHYEGRYCVGCEQFYKPSELAGGRCPEHGTVPDVVAEQNWFFRLSRYAGQLHDLISSGRLRIEPAARRNEVLGFIAGGLEDFSVSRSTARARGWGIPVPGDPDQVIYVWWDALGNYITSLGYGTGSPDYQRWWADAGRRVHLVGKGVLRFHAVYWPAILLSAGEPLPTAILVHDYLTIGGSKISKSGLAAPTGGAAGETADPVALVERYGTDAVRWWLLREVPRLDDADFTAARLVARANEDLANDLGNLVSRVVTLVHRCRNGRVPAPGGARRGRPVRRGPVRPGPARPAGREQRRPPAGSRRAGCLRFPGRHRSHLGRGPGGQPVRGADRALASGPGRARRRPRDGRPAGRVSGPAGRHLCPDCPAPGPVPARPGRPDPGSLRRLGRCAPARPASVPPPRTGQLREGAQSVLISTDRTDKKDGHGSCESASRASLLYGHRHSGPTVSGPGPAGGCRRSATGRRGPRA